MSINEREKLVTEFLDNGKQLFEMGHYQELLEICFVFSNKYVDERVYAMMSSAHFALGDLASAEKCARQGLILNPNSSDNLYNLEVIIEERGKSDCYIDTAISCVDAKVLIVSDAYPSPDNLYASMFVHARVREYRKRGLNPRIFVIRYDDAENVREYEGSAIIEGSTELLESVIEKSNVELVLVHFLWVAMWRAIYTRLGKVKVIIYCHGYEIQPFHRREFSYKPDEMEFYKKVDVARKSLWDYVFNVGLQSNCVHLVFVSQYFADEVMEDYDVTIPADKYSIIHNAIDVDLFKYVEKDAELRKKIFCLASFRTVKYARDIAVNVILKLSEYDEFADMEFLFAGSGPLWDELTKPLEEFPNVKLENRFFTHQEIADLQLEYGVFLAPTRWDSQGVSKDEAMASGLVPISNVVSAIPEFIDDECGILCAPESVDEMAEAVLKLYREPKLFKKLSKNAAERVRSQVSSEIVIEQEMALFEKMREAPTPDFVSKDYWEQRYAQGRTSGSGSYGRLADFKAEVINAFCIENNINTVVEWGCGDGNQLSLMNYSEYLGLDVSESVINICKKRFSDDSSKQFRALSDDFIIDKKYDLAVSLDVIYHLTETDVFNKYMERLFTSSDKYVCIYSFNGNQEAWASHLRFHNFTEYVSQVFPEWELFKIIPNRYQYDKNDPDNTSFADFYLFRKAGFKDSNIEET